MSHIIIITSLFLLSSVFSYTNARWLKFPSVIGVMILAIGTALFTVVASSVFPALSHFLLEMTHSINFSKALLNVMLGFLLFASALRFDVSKLHDNFKGVLLISTVGVLLSTVIFACLLYLSIATFRSHLPFIYCLVFGALISPTDAVAVAALLTKSEMPDRLKTIISGESLFNDGIGLVLFVSFSEVAETPGLNFSLPQAVKLFGQEVFGGMLLGGVLGLITYRLMKSIIDFQTIVIMSITLVLSIAALAEIMHISAPLSVVIAGLLIGSNCFNRHASIKHDEYLEKTWSLMDELLNTILFVMIGLQMVVISVRPAYLLLGTVSIVFLLIARLISIILPIAFLRRTLALPYSSALILTWGGLRGGISVALALSMPESTYKPVILTASFVVVVFSVVLQGLTLNKVVKWFGRHQLYS